MTVENKISITLGREERATFKKDGFVDFWGWDPIIGKIVIRVKKHD